MTPEEPINDALAQLLAAQSELNSLRGEFENLAGKLEAANAEIVTLKTENTALVAKEQSIEKRASEKATNIMASVGQPPIDTATRHEPSATTSNPTPLKGLARVTNAIRNQFSSHE